MFPPVSMVASALLSRAIDRAMTFRDSGRLPAARSSGATIDRAATTGVDRLAHSVRLECQESRELGVALRPRLCLARQPARLRHLLLLTRAVALP